MQRIKKIGGAIVVMLALDSVASPVMAEAESKTRPQELPMVVVTANKLEQDSQALPASLVVLTGDQMVEQGLSSFSQLVGNVGSLHNIQTGSTPLISIRGIGQRLNTPGVGIYVDGVQFLDHFSLMANMAFLDLERIEILRGPQGSLYGGNTQGGVINIITRQPDNELRGNAAINIGDYGLQHLNASINVPVNNDNLFLNLAVSDIKRDGFTYNTFLNQDVDFLDEQSIRGKLRWLPRDNLDITLAFDTAKIRDGFYDDAISTQAVLEENEPYVTAYDFPGFESRDADGGSVKVRYETDNFDILSATGYRDTDYTYTGDVDGATFTGLNDVYAVNQQQVTQELSFSSKPDVAFSWLLGLYFFNDERNVHDVLDAFLPFSAPLPEVQRVTRSKTETQGYSVFGSIDYDITERWSLQAGLRYEDETQDLTTGNVTTSFGFPVAETPQENFEQGFSETAMNVGLSYQLNPNMLWYNIVSEGFRSGGFNTRSIETDDQSYAPERSLNYETGLKFTSLDHKKLLNLALFQIDIEDQQISQAVGVGIEVIHNAGESRHRGLELEVLYINNANWQFSASAAYIDAEFISFSNPLLGVDYAGNKVPFVPETTSTLAVQKYFSLKENLELFVRAELRHIGEIYYNEVNDLQGSSYNLLNMRIGLESDYWSAHLWSNNLTDERYIGAASVNPLTLTNNLSFGEPRTAGVTLQLKF